MKFEIDGLGDLQKKFKDMAELKNIPGLCPACEKEMEVSKGINRCPHCKNEFEFTAD